MVKMSQSRYKIDFMSYNLTLMDLNLFVMWAFKLLFHQQILLKLEKYLIKRLKTTVIVLRGLLILFISLLRYCNIIMYTCCSYS